MASFEAGRSNSPETLATKWKKLKEKIREVATIVYCIIFLALLTPLCYYGWREIKLHYSAANTGTGHEPRFIEFDENDRTPLICEHNLTIGPVL